MVNIMPLFTLLELVFALVGWLLDLFVCLLVWLVASMTLLLSFATPT